MATLWTAANIPDLTGKTFVVTGANSGIGFETAKALASRGGIIVLACRNLESGQQAAAKITASHPEARVDVIPLDLASLASIKRFAETFQSEYTQLDVLVNNAGIMWTDYELTGDGFESQFGTNHLGHFALTGRLVDSLLATPASRVVTVSSIAHRSGTMDFDNLMFEGGKGYNGMAAYGRSKLANLLFTYELQRHFEAVGSSSMAVAAHPGATGTNLGRHIEQRWHLQWLMPLANAMTQSAARGALPTLRAAVDPAVSGAEYFGPASFMETRGYPVEVTSTPLSHDRPTAEKLWEVSKTLTGVTFAALEKQPA